MFGLFKFVWIIGVILDYWIFWLIIICLHYWNCFGLLDFLNYWNVFIIEICLDYWNYFGLLNVIIGLLEFFKFTKYRIHAYLFVPNAHPAD